VLPPVAFQAIRFSFAALLLLGLLRWREGRVALPARDLVRLAALGAIGFGVYQVLWSTGLARTTAGDSALIVASTPVLTILVSATIRTDRLTGTGLAGAAVSFLGVVLVVVAREGGRQGGEALGDLLTLVAALCWAIYVSFGAGVLVRHSPLRATAWTVTFGALFLWPFAIVQLQGVDLPAVDPRVWLGLAWSGLLPAGLANVAVFHAIKLLGPVRITAFQFLAPVVAVGVGALWLGESIHAPQLAGGLLIAAGILAIRRPASAGRMRPDGTGARAAPRG
jgi:drug/metabolite transporter (DMT)-like permease